MVNRSTAFKIQLMKLPFFSVIKKFVYNLNYIFAPIELSH